MRVIYPDQPANPKKPGDGGTSDTLWNMAHSLLKQGHEACIVAPYTSDLYPFADVPVTGYFSPTWHRRNIIGIIFSHIKQAKVINAYCHNFDAIHTRDYLAAITYSILCKYPVVITVAGNPMERRSKKVPDFDPITSEIFFWASKIAARLKKCNFIATSKIMENWWLRTGCDNQRLHTIPLGVNTELFSKKPEVRKILKWNERSFHLLYVGRLMAKLKGLEVLFEALTITSDRIDVHLHLVGNGPLEDSLRKYAFEHGLETKISFYGWVSQDELPLYYSAADLCVLPSYSEGFGRTMLECMACGTAFLGSAVGGMVDHIQDGQNGFLLNEITSECIANTLLKIAEDVDLRRRVAVAGQQYVINNLSWDQIMKDIIENVYLPISRK